MICCRCKLDKPESEFLIIKGCIAKSCNVCLDAILKSPMFLPGPAGMNNPGGKRGKKYEEDE